MSRAPWVAVAGVGYSTVGRRTGLGERALAAQAGVAALRDAGLSPGDIDGVTTWGGEALDIGWMLGCMPLSWHATVDIAPAFAAPAISAIAAIRAGLCHTCLAFRVITQQPSSDVLVAGGAMLPAASAFDAQFTQPFGDLTPANWAGMMMRRYMHDTGATEEDFGALAIAQREWAAKNDDALLRDPLTLDEYLAARYVSQPLRLLDCDYPCDSGSAVIFTTEERARDLRQPPVFVEAATYSGVSDMSFEIMADMTVTAPAHCADQLWARTDLRPHDVDCAQLYDGFTVITLQWLEALGLCERGGAGRFVAEGHTRPGGSLPVNTDGGACNVGRRHGANYCIEATRQLRGECGDRQVPTEVAVWANAVGPFAGAVLMTSA